MESSDVYYYRGNERPTDTPTEDRPMTATRSQTTETVEVGRYSVVWAPEDEDGPAAWVVMEDSDTIDCHDTRAAALKDAKEREAEALADEAEERAAEAEEAEESEKQDAADEANDKVQELLGKIQDRAEELRGESKVEALTALLAALKTI